METKVYEKVVDRTGWPQGEWDNEPDKIQYVDEATGLICLAKRNDHLGMWCGYVGVPEGHPAHGVYYNELHIEVHGGLSYSDHCQDVENEDQGHAICHIPGPDEPKHLWWIGYDCGHAFDRKPGMEARMSEARNAMPRLPSFLRREETYRNLEYVKEQNAALASQLHAMVA